MIEEVFVSSSNARKVPEQVLNHPPREDIIFGLLRFENGVLGVLDVNWVTPTMVRESTITGEKGMFVVNYLSQELTFYENPAANAKPEGTNWIVGLGQDFTVEAGNMTRYQINKREPLRSELESFLRAIVTGNKPLVSGHDGLQALKLALQIMSQLRRVGTEGTGS